MEIGSSASANPVGQVANNVQAKVLNSARDQLETVVGTILEGAEEVTRSLPDHKGLKVNLTA